MKYTNINKVVIRLESIEKSKWTKDKLVYVCRILESYCEAQVDTVFRQNEDIFKREWTQVK